MSEDLEAAAKTIGRDWQQNRYYEASEGDIGVFWSDRSKFKQQFDRLRLNRVVELACGHGKQSQYIIDKCERLIFVDINAENLEFCKTRYAGYNNTEFLLTNGYNLAGIEDQSIDSIFCYDAMVHFPQQVVESYLSDVKRILKIGGRGLFHHSNLAAPMSLDYRSYSKNPHGRNIMSQYMFQRYALEAGMKILSSEVFPWGNVNDLDCLTLVES